MDGEALSALLRPKIEGGIGLGYGQTKGADNYANTDAQHTDKSALMQAYLLARNPWLGAEIGYMKLPEYHSRVSVPDYPVYKGLPTGTYPQTAAGQQDITANGVYGRLNAYGPKLMGMEPYGFYGRAKVSTDNHEQALYNGIDKADFRETLKKLAPMYGLGVQAPLSKDSYLRAELGKIPHASVGAHLGDRDMKYGLLGLGYQF